MSDVFREMVERPGFSDRESLVEMLKQQTADEWSGTNLYKRHRDESPFFVVDGLSVAYEGITCVYMDMASGGRPTCSNPEPPLPTPKLSIVDRQTGYNIRRVQPAGHHLMYIFSFDNTQTNIGII